MMFPGMSLYTGEYHLPEHIKALWDRLPIDQVDNFAPIIELGAADFKGLIHPASFVVSGTDNFWTQIRHPTHGGESWGKAYKMAQTQYSPNMLVILIPHVNQIHHYPKFLAIGILPDDFVNCVMDKFAEHIFRQIQQN